MGKSAGKIMPLPRGPYDATATYNILDMVTLNNKLWIAKKSGVKGVTPSDDAAEWMMAVDGTTDVKGLETEVQAKFDNYDSKLGTITTSISTVDTKIDTANTKIDTISNSVTNLRTDTDNLVAANNTINSSVQSLSNRCTALETRPSVEIENTPTAGSTKAISSGAVYNLTKKTGTDGSENITNTIDIYGSLGRIVLERYATSASGQTTFDDTIKATGGSIDMRTEYNRNDNGYISSAGIEISYSPSIYFKLRDGNDTRGLILNQYTLIPWADSVTYLGNDSNRYAALYATTGTIQTSDRNEKKDIDALDDITARDLIMGLHPVTYKFINNTSDRVHYGLIAQDVETLLGHLGIENQDFAGLIKSPKTDEDGNPIEGEYRYGLRYDEFIAPLIKMCQNLQNEVTELRAEIETLKNK